MWGEEDIHGFQETWDHIKYDWLGETKNLDLEHLDANQVSQFVGAGISPFR